MNKNLLVELAIALSIIGLIAFIVCHIRKKQKEKALLEAEAAFKEKMRLKKSAAEAAINVYS